MTHLRLDQNQVDEEHHKIMLDVFVGKSLASGTLRETHALAERAVIGLAVACVERLDRIPGDELLGILRERETIGCAVGLLADERSNEEHD